MPGEMSLCIWDVEHGACTTLAHRLNGSFGRLAMIDSGDASDWRPSTYIRHGMGRTRLDYLFVTNADQDHLSDLHGLWETGIDIGVLHRNPDPPPAALRGIKLQGGSLTKDIERYLSIHESYNQPAVEPFNAHMGGITARTFYNSYPAFTDTNNLSCAVFVAYAGFKILFPGDLERPGWLALLARADFLDELAGIDVLVAAHHGHKSGYCAEVFDHCQPRVVVMSDKAIVDDPQKMANAYHYQVAKNHPNGVYVSTTSKRRHVLTTRRDGHIEFIVLDNGDFEIHTEYHG
jgi:beta-lactamase superfamily II metal-dependent hydrolase